MEETKKDSRAQIAARQTQIIASGNPWAMVDFASDHRDASLRRP